MTRRPRCGYAKVALALLVLACNDDEDRPADAPPSALDSCAVLDAMDPGPGSASYHSAYTLYGETSVEGTWYADSWAEQRSYVRTGGWGSLEQEEVFVARRGVDISDPSTAPLALALGVLRTRSGMMCFDDGSIELTGEGRLAIRSSRARLIAGEGTVSGRLELCSEAAHCPEQLGSLDGVKLTGRGIFSAVRRAEAEDQANTFVTIAEDWLAIVRVNHLEREYDYDPDGTSSATLVTFPEHSLGAAVYTAEGRSKLGDGYRVRFESVRKLGACGPSTGTERILACRDHRPVTP